MPEITETQAAEVITFIEDHPHVKNLYFTRDGNFHINVYARGEEGKLYAAGGSEFSAQNGSATALEDLEIVETVSREEVLAAKEKMQAPAIEEVDTTPAVITESKTEEVAVAISPAVTDPGAGAEQ